MKKLLKGIVEFRKNVRPGYRERFAQLALGQSPDTLFIACSDSRVVPNLFASTDPGDLFVLRNVGNLVPPCGPHGISTGDLSEAAAIEFAVTLLKVSDVIVCGHSECGAMTAIATGAKLLDTPNLGQWLRYGQALAQLPSKPSKLGAQLSVSNQVSQRNVLLQLENILTYPAARQRVEEGKLHLHAWWFDIAAAEVRAFSSETGEFVVIDEAYVDKIK